jgi:hypothetical protein
MTLSELTESVGSNDTPDSSLSLPLQALWWDAKGDWHQAHDVCQSAGSVNGDWVHAYLHRKEGDLGNASYWYNRARQPIFQGTLEEEWDSLVQGFLEAE